MRSFDDVDWMYVGETLAGSGHRDEAWRTGIAWGPTKDKEDRIRHNLVQRTSTALPTNSA